MKKLLATLVSCISIQAYAEPARSGDACFNDSLNQHWIMTLKKSTPAQDFYYGRIFPSFAGIRNGYFVVNKDSRTFIAGENGRCTPGGFGGFYSCSPGGSLYILKWNSDDKTITGSLINTKDPSFSQSDVGFNYNQDCKYPPPDSPEDTDNYSD